jgi:hypothetical protein
MRRILIYISIFLLPNLVVKAQIVQERNLNRGGIGQPGGQIPGQGVGGQDGLPNQEVPKSPVKREVRNWKLTDDYTRADSIPVDTLSQGFQIHSPAFRESMVNVQLGNIGAPWKSAMISDMPIYSRFLFTENLNYFFAGPETGVIIIHVPLIPTSIINTVAQKDVQKKWLAYFLPKTSIKTGMQGLITS